MPAWEWTARQTTQIAMLAAESLARLSSCGLPAMTMEELYGDVLAVWRPWTRDLRGGPVESGHHMAKDAPEQLAAELNAFLNATRTGTASAPH